MMSAVEAETHFLQSPWSLWKTWKTAKISHTSFLQLNLLIDTFIFFGSSPLFFRAESRLLLCHFHTVESDGHRTLSCESHSVCSKTCFYLWYVTSDQIFLFPLSGWRGECWENWSDSCHRWYCGVPSMWHLAGQDQNLQVRLFRQAPSDVKILWNRL